MRHASFFSGEPLCDHPDTNDETSANKPKQEARDGERRETVGHRKADAKNATEHEKHRVHQARTKLIDQHSNKNARRYGQRHVDDQERAHLLFGKAHRRLDGGHQWRVIEPDDETCKKRHPGQMQNPDLGLTAE